ncbi:MAG TPA: hypothetical protein VHT03_09890 [Rhizomicrobium sp.]|jgi:hypothetical protein|nr:hypothetical protein [Rhizomicrobium sp.]
MNDDATGAGGHARPNRERMKTSARRTIWALVLCGAGAFAGAAAAQTGYIGILGGGPVYKHIAKNIRELKKSGFNELIVWSTEVNSSGDLNLNGEFPLTSGGVYIGDQTYPDFPADLKRMKKGTVTRITLSIGSSNYGDWENVQSLVESQGTGPDSILYQDFAALKAALPLDAIDFDIENGYDSSSTIKFAVMLGKLGYNVTMDPYTNASFWTSVVSQINTKRPGTVDAVHLQTYAGGEGNSPCATEWDFSGVPVYPGVSDQPSAPPYKTPAQAKAAMDGWHKACGITGGWLWIFDQIAGTSQVRAYAHAITKGVGGADR